MKRSPHRLAWTMLLLLTLTSGTVRAVEPDDDADAPLWQASGFGTLGAVVSDSTRAHFHRDGQAARTDGPRIDAEVDSNLGLQLDLRPLPGLHGMVQGVLMRRFERHAEATLTWATVDWQGPASTVWRAGRMALPVYAESEHRRVSYASPWMRPPAEVYGLALVDTLTGANLSWLGSGALQGWQLTGLAGRSQVERDSQSRIEVSQVRGLALAWQPEHGIGFQASQVRGLVHLQGQGQGQVNDLYRFSSLSGQWTQPHWLLKSEMVWRHSSTNPAALNARGAYLLGGIRMGPWLPFAVLARSSPDGGSGGLGAGSQKTLSAGLRWDLAERCALKVQLDRVEVLQAPALSFGYSGDPLLTPTPGLPPPGRLPAGAISVLGASLSFVF